MHRVKNRQFMKKRIVMTLLFKFVFMAQAWGAQCSALPEQKALKAQKLIADYVKQHQIAVVDMYCEACRDEYPKALVVESVALSDFQIKGYKEISVNNKAIDLAYMYINGENVASMVGCKAIGVDRYL